MASESAHKPAWWCVLIPRQVEAGGSLDSLISCLAVSTESLRPKRTKEKLLRTIPKVVLCFHTHVCAHTQTCTHLSALIWTCTHFKRKDSGREACSASTRLGKQVRNGPRVRQFHTHPEKQEGGVVCWALPSAGFPDCSRQLYHTEQGSPPQPPQPPSSQTLLRLLFLPQLRGTWAGTVVASHSSLLEPNEIMITFNGRHTLSLIFPFTFQQRKILCV